MEGQFLLEMFRAEPKLFVFIVYQRSPISSADVSLCHSWNHAHADLDSSFLFSSAAHFKNALQSRFSAQQSSLASPISEDVFHNSSGKDLEDDEADRRYTCPQPNCFKAYRQPSGLRYHLKHVRHYWIFARWDLDVDFFSGTSIGNANPIARGSTCVGTRAAQEG